MEVAVANRVAAGDSSVRASVAGARAVAVVWQLAACAEALGRWPNQAEYAAHWKITERTAQSDWRAVREAFEGERTPDRLARKLREHVFGARLEDPAAAFSAPFEPPVPA